MLRVFEGGVNGLADLLEAEGQADEDQRECDAEVRHEEDPMEPAAGQDAPEGLEDNGEGPDPARRAGLCEG